MKDRDTVKTVTNIHHKLTERMLAATDTRIVIMSDRGIGQHPKQTFTKPKTGVGLLTKTCCKISGWRGGQKCPREQTPTTMPYATNRKFRQVGNTDYTSSMQC
jgi:hypothetical protein